MNTSGRLLVLSILAVVLIAPPAYPQQKTSLDTVDVDVLRLGSQLKDLQTASEQKNAELKGLIEQMTARFTALDNKIGRAHV